MSSADEAATQPGSGSQVLVGRRRTRHSTGAVTAKKPQYQENDSDDDPHPTNHIGRRRYDHGPRHKRTGHTKDPRVGKTGPVQHSVGQGKLSRLVEMPTDIILECLRALTIADLTALTRVSSALRELLLSRRPYGLVIWSDAFSRLYDLGLPICPKELDLPRYAELLSLRSCTRCHALATISHSFLSVGLGVRLCARCRKTALVPMNSRRILDAQVAVRANEKDAVGFSRLDPRLMTLATVVMANNTCHNHWYHDDQMVYIPELEEISDELIQLEDGQELAHFRTRLAISAAKRNISTVDKYVNGWLCKAAAGTLPAQQHGHRTFDNEDDSIDSDGFSLYDFSPSEVKEFRELDFVRPPRPVFRKVEPPPYVLKLVDYLKGLDEPLFSESNVNWLRSGGHLCSTDLLSSIDDDACKAQLPRLRKLVSANEERRAQEHRELVIRNRISTLAALYSDFLGDPLLASQDPPPICDLLFYCKAFRTYASAADRTEEEDEQLLDELENSLKSDVEAARQGLASDFLAAFRRQGYGLEYEDDVALHCAVSLWSCGTCYSISDFSEAIKHRCEHHEPIYLRPMRALPKSGGPALRQMAPINANQCLRIITALEAAGIPAQTPASAVAALGKVFFVAPSANLPVDAYDPEFDKILSGVLSFGSLVAASLQGIFAFEHAIRRITDEGDEAREDLVEMACCKLCNSMRPGPVRAARHHIGVAHGVIVRSDEKCADLDFFQVDLASLELSETDKVIQPPADFQPHRYQSRYRDIPRSVTISQQLPVAESDSDASDGDS